MSFAIVMMVRNECDIIELSLRHAAHLASRVVVLDHLSDDGTEKIIETLAREFEHLSFRRIEELHFDQAKHTTAAVRQLAREEPGLDFIIPLDADEFLPFRQPQEASDYFHANLTREGCGLMPWITYCPIEPVTLLTAQSLTDSFRPRSSEPQTYYKVVIGGDCAPHCRVRSGNHRIVMRGRTFTTTRLDLALQHFPVRSAAQIIRKTLIGEYAMALKPRRRRTEAYHWAQMAQRIRQNGYALSQEELETLARSYAIEDPTPPFPDLDPATTAILSDAARLTSPDLSEISVASALDKFVVNLISRQKRPRYRWWHRLSRRA